MKNDLMIRIARPGDINALLDIENRCFSSDLIKPRQMRHLLAKAKALALVSCDSHSEPATQPIIAYGLVLTPQQPRPARLYSLAVLPEYRGRGIASKLLHELLKTLSFEGYQSCTLEVRKNDISALQLYERAGFEPVRTLANYYEDGGHALRMKNRLTGDQYGRPKPASC